MNTKALILVAEYIEAVWNHGDFSALDRLTSTEFTYVLGGQPPMDRIAMRGLIESTRLAFPDWQVRVVDSVSDGDIVAVRWQGQATHLGGFRGIPATGKRISVTGINMYRVLNGTIAAEWEQMDSLGMLTQLGVGPQQEHSSART